MVSFFASVSPLLPLILQFNIRSLLLVPLALSPRGITARPLRAETELVRGSYSCHSVVLCSVFRLYSGKLHARALWRTQSRAATHIEQVPRPRPHASYFRSMVSV